MRDRRYPSSRVALVVAVFALLAAACSSGDDDESTVRAEVAESTTTTTAALTTSSEPEPVAAIESAPEATLVIEDEIDVDTGVGTFEVTNGADLLGCSRGTNEESEDGEGLLKLLTCESGERVGTISVRFLPGDKSWAVSDATEDFAGLSGNGDWSGEANGSTAGDTLSGEIAFAGPEAKVGVPLATFDRLNDRLGECGDAYTATDGLSETATVGDKMLMVSFVTGEITEHGAPPVNCAPWLGDETTGRAIASNWNGTRFWFGPLDGPFDVDVTFDEPAGLLSRTIRSNRVVMVSGSGLSWSTPPPVNALESRCQPPSVAGVISWRTPIAPTGRLSPSARPAQTEATPSVGCSCFTPRAESWRFRSRPPNP